MTKGLHLCRHLHKAGWRVVLVDYDRWWMQGSRLSSCCAAFHIVPDPEQDSIGKTGPEFAQSPVLHNCGLACIQGLYQEDIVTQDML